LIAPVLSEPVKIKWYWLAHGLLGMTDAPPWSIELKHCYQPWLYAWANSQTKNNTFYSHLSGVPTPHPRPGAAASAFCRVPAVGFGRGGTGRLLAPPECLVLFRFFRGPDRPFSEMAFVGPGDPYGHLGSRDLATRDVGGIYIGSFICILGGFCGRNCHLL